MPGDWGVWKIVLQRSDGRWRLPPKSWRFVRGHDKPMHGSCPIYFPGSIYVYIYIVYMHTIHRRRCLVGLYTYYTNLYYSTSLLQKDLPSQISPCGLQPTGTSPGPREPFSTWIENSAWSVWEDTGGGGLADDVSIFCVRKNNGQ